MNLEENQMFFDYLNGDIDSIELYGKQSSLWSLKNEELFGISARKLDTDISEIKQGLNEDVKKYWVEGTCKLKDHLLNDNMIKDLPYLILGTWGFEFNPSVNTIALSVTYAESIRDSSSDPIVNVEEEEIVRYINTLSLEEKNEIIEQGIVEWEGSDYSIDFKRHRIAYLPFVTKLGYMIKDSQYALRIQAKRNGYLIRKKNGKVRYKGGEWENGEFKDGVNFFKEVNEKHLPFLDAILGEKVTEENFSKALELLPEYSRFSICYYTFSWFEEVENRVLGSKRIKINGRAGKTISYSSLIKKQNKFSKNTEVRDLSSNLVSIKNETKAIEISRSILYAPSADLHGGFRFEGTESILDCFKTPTSGLAGRQRLLLDNMFVYDGKLCCVYDGKLYNHYDLSVGEKHLPEELRKENNVSCLSCSMYNFLNDAKRIMFCAKFKTQAKAVKGQVSEFTHEVPTRVVFADFEGYSFGDSFIISESYAKKLESTYKAKLNLRKSDIAHLKDGDMITWEELGEMDCKNRYSSLRDIKVVKKGKNYLRVEARAPFGVGDKITNMHGSKGIVSLILPDDQMPILKNDLSPLMPAGPVDVIVPGLSVFRRKSTGQVFEAMARALDIKQMTIDELKKKHYDEIKKFCDNSIFSFQGKEFKAPCGINYFVRLDHDAISKQSFAYIQANYNNNLRVAEMELLNLASRSKYSILKELDVRSINKHSRPFVKIGEMQRTGRLVDEPANLSQLKTYFKCLGWDFKTSVKEDERLEDDILDEIVNADSVSLTKDEIDLF